MHNRSTSADFQHLDTPFQVSSHRGSFSSMNSSVDSSNYYPAVVAMNGQHQPLPPPPPNSTQKPAHMNTFVHKLYNMVVDVHYQHLISWSYTGSSFIVCNIMEFSRDVLPKHFKHNNFSSFVRQLNMYGFHKVNKSPKGHRTLAENQIWEFSHQKFLRNRPDFLDDIKRKSMETDPSRRDNTDMTNHVSLLQVSQSEIIQQIQGLYESFTQVVKELEETKQKQENQMQFIKFMMTFITQQNRGQLPNELAHLYEQYEQSTTCKLTSQQQQQERPPSIFVTSHTDPQHQLNDVFDRTATSPSVHTQNLVACNNNSIHQRTASLGSLGPYGATTPNHLPPSPSPSMLLSDDELDNSLYSPNNSPHTPIGHQRHNSASSSSGNSLQAAAAHHHQSTFAYMNSPNTLSHT